MKRSDRVSSFQRLIALSDTKAWKTQDFSKQSDYTIKEGQKYIVVAAIKAQLGGTILQVLAPDGEHYYIFGRRDDYEIPEIKEIYQAAACQALVSFYKWAVKGQTQAREFAQKPGITPDNLHRLEGAHLALEDLKKFISEIAKQNKIKPEIIEQVGNEK